MRVRIDLHVHSVLSACCSRENTIQNIVNMSKLLGTGFLGVADHNTCQNFPAVSRLCKKEGIVAVPAMEVTTAEEIHTLCLFKDFDAAKTLSEEIAVGLPSIPLDERFYHPQCVMDECDTVVSQVPNLLNVACDFDIYSLVSRVSALGGVLVPAHVDKESASLISVLGCVPEDLKVNCLEISKSCPETLRKELSQKYLLIESSDAHCLEDMCAFDFFLELSNDNIDGLFQKLSKSVL